MNRGSAEVDVTFHPFDREFFDASTVWLANPELRYLTMARESSYEERLKWFEGLPTRTDFIIRGLALNGKPIGCFGFRNVDRTAHRGEFWSQIGVPSLWGQGLGKWMLAEGVRIAIREGFEEISTKVASYNERSLRATRHFFKIEKEENGIIVFEAPIHELSPLLALVQ